MGLQYLDPVPPKQSILTSLTSMMNTNPNPVKLPLIQQVIPIPDEYILLIHGNALRLYRYW